MSSTIPCLSLWQPFASLIFALGEDGKFIKRHETRGFCLPQTKRGETVAVHATAGFCPKSMVSAELHALCVRTFGPDYRDTLPRGGLIGTVRFTGASKTNNLIQMGYVTRDDHAAGDWRDRGDNGKQRYGWPITDVRPISFVPMKGRQGWFSVSSDQIWHFPAEIPHAPRQRDEQA